MKPSTTALGWSPRNVRRPLADSSENISTTWQTRKTSEKLAASMRWKNSTGSQMPEPLQQPQASPSVLSAETMLMPSAFVDTNILVYAAHEVFPLPRKTVRRNGLWAALWDGNGRQSFLLRRGTSGLLAMATISSLKKPAIRLPNTRGCVTLSHALDYGLLRHPVVSSGCVC